MHIYPYSSMSFSISPSPGLLPQLRSHSPSALLKRRRQKILQQPERHRNAAAFHHAEHHHLQEPLVQVPGRQREHVHTLVLFGTARPLFHNSCFLALPPSVAQHTPHVGPEAAGEGLRCRTSRTVFLFLRRSRILVFPSGGGWYRRGAVVVVL